MRRRIASTFTLALLGAALMAGTAAASEVQLRGSLAAASDYRFRGVSQNDRKVAPQASLNLETSDGWYVGAWGSQLDFDNHPRTSIEVDVYAGKRFALGEDTSLSIQGQYYAYPNHDSDKAGYRADYAELIVGLSHKIGDLTLGGTVAYSPDWFAESGAGWWVNATAAYAVNEWLSASGGVGRQSAAHFNAGDFGYPYMTWDFGVTATWWQLALDLRYVDTDIAKGQCAALNGPTNGNWCDATVVGTLSWYFNLI